MIEFLRQYLGSIICGIAVFGIIFLIIWNTVRKKKKGISSCGCGCSNCPMSGSCHGEKTKT
ncbi:MAG: FeoB-associated Cys-rich membrane protein [Clostridiales bacterium]|nr:FeoB-associated Cys-rich membrane protein [Clostridiales bacterium]